MGPLHGLPISVKECMSMKDLDVNSGFAAWVGNTAHEDALVLDILQKAGCVFHARTTLPQTIVSTLNLGSFDVSCQGAYRIKAVLLTDQRMFLST